jgi:hypothetical protein
MAMQVEIQPKTQAQGPTPRPAKQLSANFAELMASAQGTRAAAATTPETTGPKKLSANFAELMANAGVAGAAPAPREADSHLDPSQRSTRSIKEGPKGHGGGSDFKFFGKDGFNVGDVIDVINPLQHIPIVNLVYRWLTGDEISPASELAGGFLYGGPIGLAASAASVAVTAAVGEGDLGAGAMQMALGDSPLKDTINLADVEPLPQWGVDGQGQPQPKAPSLAAPAGETAQVASAPAAPAPAPARPTKLVMGHQASAAAAGAAAMPASDGPATLTEDQLAELLTRGTGKRALKPLPPPGAPGKFPKDLPKPAPATTAALPPGAVAVPPHAVRAATTAEDIARSADTSGIAAKMSSAWDKYEAMKKQQTPDALAPLDVPAAVPVGKLRISA